MVDSMAVDLSVLDGYKSVIDRQQLQQAFELKKALAAQQLAKEARGGDLPAPIQIANEMFKYKQLASRPDIDESTRRMANDRYNLLGQAAKTYGFAPGLQYDLGSPQPTFNAPPPKNQPTTPLGADNRNLPSLPPMTNPQAAASVIDLFGEGNSTGVNNAPPPAMRPTLANAPAPTAGTVPGFANASANIAATKKGAETQAQKNVELDMNPQIKTAEVSAEGKAKKVLANDVTLGDLGAMRSSIQDARDLVSKVSMTGPILGRIGAIAQDPDYRNLQGALNSITLQAKELYNLGSGQGFTDADRDFLQEIVSGKYARAEAIPMALDRLDKALARREKFLQGQNANYGGNPSPEPVADDLPLTQQEQDELNALRARYKK